MSTTGLPVAVTVALTGTMASTLFSVMHGEEEEEGHDDHRDTV